MFRCRLAPPTHLLGAAGSLDDLARGFQPYRHGDDAHRAMDPYTQAYLAQMSAAAYAAGGQYPGHPSMR